jgi:hypothetical protein
MSLWWLVFETNGVRCVWIEEASDLLQARTKAASAGQPMDTFVEGHQLDRLVAKKLTEDLIDRRIAVDEAYRQLGKLT